MGGLFRRVPVDSAQIPRAYAWGYEPVNELGYFTQRGPENTCFLDGRRHPQNIFGSGRHVFPDYRSEIFVQREQGVRFQFTECPPQFLLDAVNRVKEDALVELELPTAEFPVGTQEEMKTKEFIFEFIQNPFTYQAKIGNIFLIFATPDRTALLAANDLEPHLAHAFLLLQTMSEPGIAGTKNSSENTVAGRFR
jgi:hypothetical protein